MSQNIDENKILNGFTVLSFNPNNQYVSFKVQNYFLSNKIWRNQTFQTKLNLKSSNSQNKKLKNNQYWIIEQNNKNKIKIINSNQLYVSPQSIKAGPIFNVETAVLILNYFNDMEL